MNHWHWPQITFLVLIGITLGNSLAKHGEMKDGRWSFWTTAIGVGIELWLLTAGGFFR